MVGDANRRRIEGWQKAWMQTKKTDPWHEEPPCVASDRTTCQSSRTRMETNKGARIGHIRASSTPCEHHNGTGNCSGNGYGNTLGGGTPQALCLPLTAPATWSNRVSGPVQLVRWPAMMRRWRRRNS